MLKIRFPAHPPLKALLFFKAGFSAPPLKRAFKL
jgi:hypothetical protein